MVDQGKENWQRLWSVEDLKKRDLQQLEVGRTSIALSYRNGEFGAVSGRCNHAGGPLGQGLLKDDYIVCPWHSWMFHRLTGEARPGIPAAVPRHTLRIQDRDLYIDIAAATPRIHAPHAKHPLSRDIVRDPGPLRVAGISAAVMNVEFPRYSHPKIYSGIARLCRLVKHRNALDPSQRSALPRLRRLLLEERACLHLALHDHADGSRRSARRGL